MKKLLSAVLALAMAGAVMATPAFAEGEQIEPQSETPLENVFVFEQYGDNGWWLAGLAADYTLKDAVVGGVLTFPDAYQGKPVKAIKDFAFKNLALDRQAEGAKSVHLPAQLERIGNDSLRGVSATDNGMVVAFEEPVVVPDTVNYIGGGAFNAATFPGVIINSNIDTIYFNTFDSCFSLETVTLPASITSIGQNAFRKCPNLKTVNYGGKVSQWQNIAIDPQGNEILTTGCVTIHCVDDDLGGHLEDEGAVTKEPTCTE